MPAEGESPVLGQVAEEVELPRGEGDGATRDPRLPASGVDLDSADGDDVGRLAAGAFGAAQDGFHPGDDLARRERLGDVVVGAQLEAEHAVDLGAARGEHDHGHVDAAAAELPADVPAAHPGHHDVEQHEVGCVAQGEREGVLAVRGRDGLIALEAQIVLEAAYDLRLVVRDQDPSHGPPPRATG